MGFAAISYEKCNRYPKILRYLLHFDCIFATGGLDGLFCIFAFMTGNLYRVLYIAKHSETLEEMVVYQAMYGEKGIWVRPKAMFEEVIERDGKTLRRFEEITDDEAQSLINPNSND